MSQDWRDQLRRFQRDRGPEGHQPAQGQGSQRGRRGDGTRERGSQLSREKGRQGGDRSWPLRPIYSGGLEGVFQGGEPPQGANVGLVYDRYADIWKASRRDGSATDIHSDSSLRHEFLKKMVGSGTATPGWARRELERIKPLLEAFHRRRSRLWQSIDALPLELVLSSPMVSGVGMTHALTAGFVWDRNLGVPYLPASSLKGATRAWANPEQWGALAKDDFDRIFGVMEDTGAGSVVFHDLYPLEPPTLRIDLINPHFKDYYQYGTPPGDWLEPEPAFFLTIAPGTRFVTALHPRTAAHSKDLDMAAKCVREALENLGLGAKTAVGYGRFKPWPRPSS